MTKKRDGLFVRQNTLIRIGFGLLGVAYAALPLLHPVSNEVNFAVVVVLLLLLVDMMLELRLEAAQKGSETGRQIRRYIGERHGIFGEVLQDVHRELQHTVRFQPNGFSFHHRFIAIDAYTKFLDAMVDEQIRQRAKGKSLKVRALHSSDPDVMLGRHPLSSRIYDSQLRFCEKGGEIVRILCYRDLLPDADSIEMARRMIAVGVKVRYYSISKGVVSHPFSWDFLYIEDKKQALVWDSFTRAASAITDATFLESVEYDGCALDEVWGRIYENSVEIVFD